MVVGDYLLEKLLLHGRHVTVVLCQKDVPLLEMTASQFYLDSCTCI